MWLTGLKAPTNTSALAYTHWKKEEAANFPVTTFCHRQETATFCHRQETAYHLMKTSCTVCPLHLLVLHAVVNCGKDTKLALLMTSNHLTLQKVPGCQAVEYFSQSERHN